MLVIVTQTGVDCVLTVVVQVVHYQNTECRIFTVYEYHRYLPYDCIQETSKVIHTIIHKHKYTYIVKHRGLYV